MWEDGQLLEHAFGWRPKMAGMKSYVGLSGSKVLKDSGLRVLFTWHRDTDGVTVCDQIQSAGLVSVPKWMPRKSTLCLCWACPSLPGRTVVKWALGHDRSIWEVKDSTGSYDAQLCGGIGADTPTGPLPGHITMSRGASFSCEFLFLSKMKGVRSSELLGSFYHWNSKNLLVSKTSWVKEMCCTCFSNFTFKQLLSQQNRNNLLVEDSLCNRNTINM